MENLCKGAPRGTPAPPSKDQMPKQTVGVAKGQPFKREKNDAAF